MAVDLETDPLWLEFDGLEESLGGDLSLLERLHKYNKTQAWRRAYCRAVSAYVEGMTSWMARYTLHYYDGVLGHGEKRTLESRLSALERAFHAFDLFCDTAGATTPLKRNGKNFAPLRAMIRVRNRLTHPSQTSDVLVGDNDLVVIVAARDAIVSLIDESLLRCKRALLKRCDRMRTAFKRYHGCLPDEASAEATPQMTQDTLTF